MRFENDIFISYAHLDDRPLMPDAEGWVSQFHRALEVRVDQLLGEKASVWRDPKLQGNDYFNDAIAEQLPKVALLVSVFTPRYVHSDACLKELSDFCRASQLAGGLRIGDKARIFKVLKTPVPLEEHPEPVRDCLGYEFFKVDPASGRIRELNRVFGGDAEREFWIKLDDLAQDLCQLLKWLEHTPIPSDETQTQTDTVFIADCSFDVREQYDYVKRDLLGNRYRVLPDAPLPLNVDALLPALRKYLDQSQLSVHLIGRSYGIVPEGTERSVVELQNELAIEREDKGGFTRLVWIAPGIEVEDERQKRFVESLRSDPRPQKGADLLETSLEDLNTQIHHALARRIPRNAEPETRAASAPAQVYLMCDSRDAGTVTPIADYLFEHGCEVVLPAFQGDEAEVRADHEQNLRSADAFLIYYGAPNELWLRGKLRERHKSTALGRMTPLKATAILVAPPHGRNETWLRVHEARVIHQDTKDFAGELLDPFLADLRA
jgi:hypothetical protein